MYNTKFFTLFMLATCTLGIGSSSAVPVQQESTTDTESLAPAQAPALSSRQTAQDFATATLTQHNNFRATKGIAPLAWDESLAASAQQFANELAATNRFQHSRNRRNTGENLFKIFGGSADAGAIGTRAVQSWANERIAYERAGEPAICGAGVNFGAIGHWTQVMWTGSTKLGCGIGVSGGSKVVVCQYQPAGNVCGQKPY
ncbi:hypothetical protein HK102_002129 [Quaeritorhiza haematococci]|nr:hypothetical protein HK102_002129 [Quaeritorhiza haematococci]